MLAFIRGKVLTKKNNFLIVEANNLGYQIFVSEKVAESFSLQQEVELYLHHHVKEDINDLYGFSNIEALELFDLLISVSGIGPKSGLNILNLFEVAELKQAIACGDAALLTKASGVGKKTAERLCLELKNKVDVLVDSSNSNLTMRSDEIDALMALGYSLMQAREALDKTDPLGTSQERIKQALKSLGR